MKAVLECFIAEHLRSTCNGTIEKDICKIYPTSVLNPEDPKKTKDILLERLYSAHLLWSGCLGTGLELTANKNMKHFYLRTVGVTGRVQEVHL
ncbi:hypothetical protein T09_772 [Trichinella sp. T9]|nr:hypothetical protein T09_772 [Trichinella sp. T9]